MNREIFDTVSGKRGERMSVVKEKGTTYVPYSSGHELTWEKTEQGDGKRLKEVRTLTKIKTPHSIYISGFGEGTHDFKKTAKENTE